MNRLEKEGRDEIEIVTGFSKIFKQVYAVKLSCHGYIVVVG